MPYNTGNNAALVMLVNKSMKRISILLLAGVLSFAGCETDTPVVVVVDEGSVVTNIGSEFITPEYFEFDNKVGVLVKGIGDFDLDRTQANLDLARQSWLDAHAAWERTEAFFFGPAAKANLTTNLDSFPVSITDIREILKFTPQFDRNRVLNFDGTLKGFHLIEFLLWDSAGTKQIADFTPKEFEYIRAVASDIWELSRNQRLDWDPNRLDYNKNFREAGQSGSVYDSAKQVLKTMLDAMTAALRDLADRKIGVPLAPNYGSRYEESHFSSSSAADYYNNLIGVRNLYLGGVEESGYSISALVRQKNFLLDDRIRQEIAEALAKVQAFRPTFAASLATNRAAVIAAQEAIRILERSLAGEAMIITQ